IVIGARDNWRPGVESDDTPIPRGQFLRVVGMVRSHLSGVLALLRLRGHCGKLPVGWINDQRRSSRADNFCPPIHPELIVCTGIARGRGAIDVPIRGRSLLDLSHFVGSEHLFSLVLFRSLQRCRRRKNPDALKVWVSIRRAWNVLLDLSAAN